MRRAKRHEGTNVNIGSEVGAVTQRCASQPAACAVPYDDDARVLCSSGDGGASRVDVPREREGGAGGKRERQTDRQIESVR